LTITLLHAHSAAFPKKKTLSVSSLGSTIRLWGYQAPDISAARHAHLFIQFVNALRERALFFTTMSHRHPDAIISSVSIVKELMGFNTK
jgi:hypothetical protein